MGRTASGKFPTFGKGALKRGGTCTGTLFSKYLSGQRLEGVLKGRRRRGWDRAFRSTIERENVFQGFEMKGKVLGMKTGVVAMREIFLLLQ